MAGTSTSWMLLLLLLPLFISFHPSSSASTCNMHEFIVSVDKLREAVMDCSENCSSVHITDRKCRCFNLSLSEGERVFPDYFIRGLESLDPSVSICQHLIKILKRMPAQCTANINFASLNFTVISPKSFWRELDNVKQQITSLSSVI